MPVTLTSDRAGLVMETGAKVKMRGVQVGRVSTITGGSDGPAPVILKLEIDPRPGQVHPGQRRGADPGHHGVRRQVRRPDLSRATRAPSGSSPARCCSRSNVSTEVNTVFENLVGVLDQIDTAKLNGVLSALAEGVRGQGERIGQATTDANQVLLALNPRSETIRADWQALKGFSDTYSAAATRHPVDTLDAASTTSVTITNNAKALDALLLNVIGLSNSGIDLLAPNQENLIKAINVLEPTTNLLMKYNPEYTCLLVGAKWLLDNGGYDAPPAATASRSSSTAACWPATTSTAIRTTCRSSGAKGGPGGKPGCGSLPDRRTTTGRCAS